MSKRTELEEILKAEYGISSIKELEKAIERMGSVDVSVFCKDINSRRNQRDRKDRTSN